MVNVSQLKKGDILKAKIDMPNMALKEGQNVRVIKTGRSSWDAMDYADALTDNGYKIEIMKNYRDFELLT